MDGNNGIWFYDNDIKNIRLYVKLVNSLNCNELYELRKYLTYEYDYEYLGLNNKELINFIKLRIDIINTRITRIYNPDPGE